MTHCDKGTSAPHSTLCFTFEKVIAKIQRGPDFMKYGVQKEHQTVNALKLLVLPTLKAVFAMPAVICRW